MSTLIIILNLIINSIFSSIEGIREAIFYHVNNHSSKSYTKDAHKLYTYLRCCYWITTFILMFLVENILLNKSFIASAFYSGLFLLSEMLMFSFFHDGFYYKQRNKLDPNIYKKGFFDSSTTSTAKIELSYKTRLYMFIAGIIVYIITALV